MSAPIGIAPIGINKIYHPSAELGVAKVAGGLGIPYSLSTGGSSPIEDVAAANEAGRLTTLRSRDADSSKIPAGPRFFQLYMPQYDEMTISLLQRA